MTAPIDVVCGLRVEKAGPLALLQDAGRFGVRRLGVTQGGPADLHAWAWANHLLDNPWGAPVLEITLGGLELIAEHDMTLALCGADLEATLDDKPWLSWQVVSVTQGQRLRFGSARSGARAYLAVAGGFLAEPVLGSVACVSREGLGGHDGHGRSLAMADRLHIDRSCQASSRERYVGRRAPGKERIDYREPARLRLIPGAQISEFSGVSLFAAFNRPWHVDSRADRMGVRLKGPPLRCRLSTMISEGIPLGAVQVPPDGQPIVLLNDRQTIGGYPRLGTLTPLACARLAQCLPEQEVWLVAETPQHAQEEYRRFRLRFDVTAVPGAASHR
ncbi:hypothetical protein L861_03985 [Litchfieldella anticariensis FP35 = DSM 16096]|uniref:Carboxyltransferase domain-containing protein n=1 Tax=Litchfieldella anticariensis (strain DSM 16096 / CECT 5854 / CIP 108499 / LMG 22089 / FP35) TaxID=1121939 RepID=S2KV78_LITA3|nr:biotin-dependent carboxyltransferase family protein [Halomonas anticariensis]EPC04493.1 hypothetical protein L861_03985 [Halomonas anticariensis FP35 = DSM 16096]